MERIEQILQRIQGIYYDESAKTNIDIDLMLDYTRVLYADLLEWKKTVPIIEVIAKSKDESKKHNEKVVLEEAELNKEHIDKATIEENVEKGGTTQKESTPEIQEEPILINQEEASDYTPEAIDHIVKYEKPIIVPDAELKEYTNSENETNMMQEIADDIIYEPTESNAEMDHETEEFFFKERPVLSFELPKSEEEMNKEQPSPTKKEQETIQNKPEQAIEHVEVQEPEMDLPQVSEPESFEIPHSNFSNLFTAVQPNLAIDIRKNIGLNDRYLFLNEMFKNNKSEYDYCLNQINAAKSFAEVQDFLVPIAAHNNWNKEDDTVLSFYAVVAKHFSNK